MPAPTTPGAMWDATAAAFEQGFQRVHQASLQTLERSQAGDAFVAEMSRTGFLQVREGTGIANEILDQRSVQSQPQQTGSVINPGSVAAGS